MKRSSKMGWLGATLLVSSLPCWGTCGFYVGLGAGAENIDFRQNAHIENPGNENILDKTHFSGKGAFGSVFAGYGESFSGCGCPFDEMNFYLAGEINADVSSVKFKSHNNELTHQNFNHASYKMPYGFGLSLLPGIEITECSLLYARLGYVNRNLKIATTENTLPNTKKRLSGFRYGIGIKQSITEDFSIRLDFSQSLYQKLKIFGLDTASNVSKRTFITPILNQFEIGVAYHFI